MDCRHAVAERVRECWPQVAACVEQRIAMMRAEGVREGDSAASLVERFVRESMAQAGLRRAP